MRERRCYIHHHKSLTHCRWFGDGLGKKVSEFSGVGGLVGIAGGRTSGEASIFSDLDRLALGTDGAEEY